ncbi:MAG: hypothetical protein JWR03_1236 [Cohnella sp.]|nr:hypothetical protein [Cohnella sp.]
MTSEENGSPSTEKTLNSPDDYTADNAVSHGGRFGTDDTAPERSQGLPPGIQNQENAEENQKTRDYD